MSTVTPETSPDPSTVLPALSDQERRVLGVMVEKAKTTPDAYPLSLNALVTGCNQKSNREPIMTLDDVEVEDVLSSLGKKGLVMQITGGRVDRWKHRLYEAWRLGKVELAVLAELLLRGPQTEGELRTRASRMEPIADLPTLRALLQPLAERRLVVYLSPEGRRGTVLTHGFHPPSELEHLKTVPRPDEDAAEGGAAPSARPAGGGAFAALEDRLTQVVAEVTALKERVARLEQKMQVGEEPSGERGCEPFQG